MNLQPVILCGGSGTRLWPLSREQYPKQLLALTGDDTMLQATARRVDGTPAVAGRQVLPPIVVGNAEYRFITAEQLRQAGVQPAAIVLEPVGRNAVPALTLAPLFFASQPPCRDQFSEGASAREALAARRDRLDGPGGPGRRTHLPVSVR